MNTHHIGGFFELEPMGSIRQNVHASATPLHTGRACISLFLKLAKPQHVYTPHYTCDSSLTPFISNDISTTPYEIDDTLFPIYLPRLNKNEFFYYINYFGLCDENIRRLNERYGKQLIVDDTHAFFKGKRDGLWSFTSARKHFGIPDGAYLYSPIPIGDNFETFNKASVKHLILRKNGKQSTAFSLYQAYEKSLDTSIYSISRTSQKILSSVNLEECANTRKTNFEILHQYLFSTNALNISFMLQHCVPYCYPYLPSIDITHKQLHSKNIYAPKLWTDVEIRGAPQWECSLSRHLLPLPIDHRYGANCMQRIIRASLQ